MGLREETAHLKELKRRRDEKSLITRLRSRSGAGPTAIRALAARYLGELRSTAAVPHLAPLLADDDSSVRLQAAVALGRIGDRRATPALIQALTEQDDRLVRARVIGSLGEIGDAAAVPHLLVLLAEDDWYFVRGQTIYALGLIDHPDAQAAYTRELARTRWTRRRTVRRAIRRFRRRRQMWEDLIS